MVVQSSIWCIMYVFPLGKLLPKVDKGALKIGFLMGQFNSLMQYNILELLILTWVKISVDSHVG